MPLPTPESKQVHRGGQRKAGGAIRRCKTARDTLILAVHPTPPMLTPSSLPSVRHCLLGASLFCAGALQAQSSSGLEKGDLVAICGDSITEQRMYSLYMEEYLLACQPVKLQVSQFGWGGETAKGFLEREDNDVLAFKPTVATLSYGMNDGGYVPTDEKRLATYRDSLDEAVKKLKAAGAHTVVVGTASAVDSTTFRSFWGTKPDVYNKTLADFGAVAKEIAQKEGVGFADVHQTMIDVMAPIKAKYGAGYALSGKGDGIHPNENGHVVMAYTFLKALGCQGDIGTLTLDMASGQGQATDGHRIVSASKDKLEVESTRYPFCFSGSDPSKVESMRGVLEFLPFNQDLNRFVLVVKNAPAGKVKVTWGDKSKEFDAAELAKGINLAAEFLDNPFSEPFAKLGKTIATQQRYETTAVKEMLHNLPDWKKTTADADAEFGSLEKGLIQTDGALRKASASAVKPVRHSIQVEAAGGQ